jgi:hypothetical protein
VPNLKGAFDCPIQMVHLSFYKYYAKKKWHGKERFISFKNNIFRIYIEQKMKKPKDKESQNEKSLVLKSVCWREFSRLIFLN